MENDFNDYFTLIDCECPKCGIERNIPRIAKYFLCDKCSNIAEKATKAAEENRLKTQRIANVDLIMRRDCRCPKDDYRLSTYDPMFNKYEGKPDQTNLVSKEFLDYILDYEINLVLCSKTPGVGKTRLVLGYMREFLIRHPRVSSIPFLDAKTFAYEIYCADRRDQPGMIAKYANKPLAVIDDIGRETACDACELLLLSRLRKRRPTLLTTNLFPSDLQLRYGGHLVDRLTQINPDNNVRTGHFIELKGTSYRQKHGCRNIRIN